MSLITISISVFLIRLHYTYFISEYKNEVEPTIKSRLGTKTGVDGTVLYDHYEIESDD